MNSKELPNGCCRDKLLTAAMSPLHFAYYALWIGPTVVEGVLVGSMAHRRMLRELPFFFAYACFDAASSVAMYVVYHKCSFVTYFLCFWPVLGIRLVLGLLAIREVVLHVFSSYAALRQFSVVIFRWLVVILAMVAVISAAAAPGVDSDRLMAGLFVAERSVRLVQVGLLVFLFLLAQFFGVSWRSYAFGIGLGFGVFASVQLGALAVRTTLGAISGNTFNLVSSAAQTCAILIWCAYLLSPERHKTMDVLPKADLQQWNG